MKQPTPNTLVHVKDVCSTVFCYCVISCVIGCHGPVTISEPIIATRGEKQILPVWFSQAVGLVRLAAVSSNDTMLTVSGRAHCEVWNMTSGAHHQECPQHSYRVVDAAISLDGQYVLTAGANESSPDRSELYLWNSTNGHIVQSFILPGEHCSLVNVALSADGSTIAALGYFPPAGATNECHRWGLERQVRLWKRSGALYAVVGPKEAGQLELRGRIRFSPDGSRIIVGTHSVMAALLDSASGNILLKVQVGDAGTSYNLAGGEFSPDSRHIAFTQPVNAVVLVWNAAEGMLTHSIDNRLGATTYPCVRFSMTGGLLAYNSATASSATSDRISVVQLFSSTWEKVAVLDVGVAEYNEFRFWFSRDGQRLICREADTSRVSIWDTKTWRRLSTVAFPALADMEPDWEEGSAPSIMTSSCGRYVVTRLKESGICAWHMSDLTGDDQEMQEESIGTVQVEGVTQ